MRCGVFERVHNVLGIALSLVLALVTATMPADAQANAPRPAYRDAHVSADDRARDLLARMTPEEKFWQLYMSPGDPRDDGVLLAHGAYGLQLMPDAADTAASLQPRERARRLADRVNRVQHFFRDSTRLGIPALLFEEGAHGLVQPGATVFPAAIALAATFDTALVARVAGVIANESRARGVRQLLSPVLNLARDPRWGRVEETFGEDPRLAADLAVAMTARLEAAGIVTTPKHFIANYGDGGRDSWPVGLSRRELERTYFVPFRAAIARGGARSVMAAYNAVDGVPAAQNASLLTGVLRHDWGFGGVTISDAAGVGGANVLHFTAPDYATATRQAITAGLDVIFQSHVAQARLFSPPFLDGSLAAARIDSAVLRVLRLKFALGLFDAPDADAGAIERTLRDAASPRLAREVARASIVLLRNERGVLPMPESATRIAVIGEDARIARLGGYTAAGARGLSVLDALRERLGARAVVSFAPGTGRITHSTVTVDSSFLEHDSAGVTRTGLRAEYFGNITLDGAPLVVRTDAHVDFSWTLGGPARGLSRDWYSARWTGALRAPSTGTIELGIEGSDGYRLWLDGRLVLDAWTKRSSGRRLVRVSMVKGRRMPIRLEYHETTGNAHVRLVWNHGVRDDRATHIAEAVRAARVSQLAVVVVGIEEGEFRDRASLALPGGQEALIRAVAATGTPTVVVLIGGGAITMSPWLDSAQGVLQAWYPGAEGGRAIVDVLMGDANPSGRLPYTIPVSEGQLPLTYDHEPTGRGDDYLDLTGHPLFPFGFGLSYSSFAYDALAIEPQLSGAEGLVVVRCTVRNTSARAGDEVVQLYLRNVVAPVAQPVLALAGFQRVHLAAGEARDVRFTLTPADLAILDADGRRVASTGDVRVYIGASSRDLRLRGTVERK